MSDSKHELNLEEIGKEEEAYGQFEALDTREALKHRGKRGYRILRHIDTARTSDDEKLLQTILTDIHQIRSELDHLREENPEEEVLQDKPEKSPLADTPQNKLFSLNTESDILAVEKSPEEEQELSKIEEEIQFSDNIEETYIEPVDSIELQMTEANMQKMGILDSDELKEFELSSLAMPHHERFNDVDIDIPLDNYPADLEAEASITTSLNKIAAEKETQAQEPVAKKDFLDMQISLEPFSVQNKLSEECSDQEDVFTEGEKANEPEIDPLDAVLPPLEPVLSQNDEEEMPGEDELSAEESVMTSLMKAVENAAVVRQERQEEAVLRAQVQEEEQNSADQQEKSADSEEKPKQRTEEDILSEFDFSDLESPAHHHNNAAVGNSSADILGEENLSRIILENDNIVSTELISLPSSDKLVELLQRPIEPVSSEDLNVVIPVGPMFDGDLSSITSHSFPIHAEEESYAVVQQAQALDESVLQEVAEAQIEAVDEIAPPQEQEDFDALLPDEEEQEPILEADFAEPEEEAQEEIAEEDEPQEQVLSTESDFPELEEVVPEEEKVIEEEVEAEDEIQPDSDEQIEEQAATQPQKAVQEEAQADIETEIQEEQSKESEEEAGFALEEIQESGSLEADLSSARVEDPEIVNEIADEVLSKDVLDALEKASQMHPMPGSASSLGATQFSYDQDLFNDLEAFIGFFENIFAKIPQDEQMRLSETLGYAAYLRVKGKVERESLRQVTSSMLDSLTLDDLESPENDKEDTSPLACYREDAMQRGRIPFVLELNRETLIAQIVVLSEDEVNMEEADVQWVSFLKDFLHSEGFVISSEMHTIVISSRPLEMSENDYLESLINDASDVFGVQPDESLFEPFFIPLDNQMVKKLSPQIEA